MKGLKILTLALLAVFCLSSNSQLQAQKIEDIHYSVAQNGKIYLHYRVRGKCDEDRVQLRIAYSHVTSRNKKQWLTLKRDYLDVEDGEIYWVGRVELANIRNFIEKSEVRFELINSTDIIDQHYFKSLLHGAKEVKPEVFVPVASQEAQPQEQGDIVKNTNTSTEKKNKGVTIGEPKVWRKPEAHAKMFGGKAFRRLEGRRILQKCDAYKDMKFVEEGVAWIFVGVDEAGKVFTAIFTAQTTDGNVSSIEDPDQKEMARNCVKAYRFRTAKGEGNQYGFVPIYFRNP